MRSPRPATAESHAAADAAPAPPSKSQRKRDSHALQDLGEALVEMSDDALVALALPEILHDAVRAYRSTRSHEGRRRQMQYVGKLMRAADAEPIRHAVTQLQLGRARDALALHEAEAWRTSLIAGDAALTDWTSAHPGTDLPALRTLVRAARSDAALAPEQRSGRAYRKLFQFIREELVHV